MHQVRPIRGEAVEKALASAASRSILSQCIREARPVKELSKMTHLPLASVYRHVGQLVKDEILVVERSALTTDGKPVDLYRSRIRAGRIEVGPEGVNVSWDANVAIEDRLLHMWSQFGA